PSLHSLPTRRSSDLTPGLSLTRRLLYQLSYSGAVGTLPGRHRLLEAPVPVGADDVLVVRDLHARRAVEPPLELAEDDPEEQVARSEEHTSELQSLAY